MQEWVFDRDGARTRHEAADQPPPVPAAPGRRRRWLAAGAAALAVLTGGGIAVAAGSAGSTATAAVASDTTTDQVVPEERAPRQLPSTEEDGDTAAATSPRWTALHEERRLQQPDGTTVTVAVQGGTITALTADSVTVESSDGYSRTYAVTEETRVAGPGGTIADLAAGDPVLVEAVVEGDTATAASIRPAPSAGDQEPPEGSGTGQDTEDA